MHFDRDRCAYQRILAVVGVVAWPKALDDKHAAGAQIVCRNQAGLRANCAIQVTTYNSGPRKHTCAPFLNWYGSC